jgi:hypothetical protein
MRGWTMNNGLRGTRFATEMHIVLEDEILVIATNSSGGAFLRINADSLGSWIVF